MQVWGQKLADKTNKGKSQLRKELEDKLEKTMRELKSSNKTQSISVRKNYENESR